MSNVYDISDFIPVKDDQANEAIEKSLSELKDEIKTVKDKKVNVGFITEDQVNKFSDRIDEVLSAMGITKTLTVNQIDLVKDAIVQRFKTGMDKIEGLVKQVNDKNYSPVIKNDVNINQAEVIQAIELMGRDVVKALNDLKIELARKKKWEFTVKRDSYDLITSITATEKL